jgi:hypothetical protein
MNRANVVKGSADPIDDRKFFDLYNGIYPENI